MAYETNDLREFFRNAELEFKRKEDERDFADEMAERETYKIPRFLSADNREERRDNRSSQSRRAAESMSRLQLLLASNPGYARLYNDTFDALRHAEAETERAIERATELLAAAQTKLQATLDKAPTLPNGTRVFKDARGQVWNEHGERVNDADAGRIEWHGNEPAYEQFLEDSESVADRLTHLEDLQGFRVDTLGKFRDKMMDQENPVSEDELRGFRLDMDNKLSDLARAEDVSPMTQTADTVPIPQAGIAVRSL